MTLRKKSLSFRLTLAIVGIFIGLGMWAACNIFSVAAAEEPRISPEAVEILSKTGHAMAEVVAAVKPAVVNISSTRTIKSQGMSHPFFNDPMFRRFFGEEFGGMEKPREYKQASLGSGVIVHTNGYILTNNHVVKDADEIKIKLSDKREFKGKVIGTDPKTDIAVIKIDAADLPVMKMGDSDKMMVGETVIAIGNPFGLSQTVTSGIVSATGRADVGITDYEDFIQTDAAINPGNSGGALVNVRGELIGINTAIFSTSGGYQGVGFAVPSNMANVVMESLVKNGKVVRGWLGVSIQPITPELAKQFGIKDDKGALIGDVVEEGPAEKAGLQRGDVIVEYDGKVVSDPTALRNMVAKTSPEKEVTVKVLREGKYQDLVVVIAELPVTLQKTAKEFDNLLKGVKVQDITPEMRTKLNIPNRATGVLITGIDEGSPSAGTLNQGDLIIEINRKRIGSMKDYDAVVSQIKPDEDILLVIFRNGSAVYVTLSAR
ncbi:MAG TPA: DegQ family serine endoprotease [Dissulfurispiraceae bacterium]|nr:DegQ family serine endoprotease [Dissulfurispiraceae bacterium]